MSQEQPRRDEQEEAGEGLQASPIRYGDVFPVAGDLADQAVAPRDAAMMQSAETRVYGQTPKGGPASVMEAAAAFNELRGAVGHEQFSDVPGSQGVSITQTAIPGRPDQRLVTEFVAGQVYLYIYITRKRSCLLRFFLILIIRDLKLLWCLPENCRPSASTWLARGAARETRETGRTKLLVAAT